MSFFEELKRRNVIRVAIAYGVATWFLLQLADLVLENIAAPAWVMQTIMLVMAIGFPMAVIFAWAFEITPEGIKKEKDIDRSQSVTHQTGRKLDRMIIGIMAAAIVFLLVDRFVVTPKAGSGSISPQVTQTNGQQGEEKMNLTPVEASVSPSVAVLPFVNMSGDANNEYFSDGLTETLLHMLAQLPGLRVAARTSSFAFKGQNASIDEIATTLGVAHILEGSVQKSGQRVRITAQLIRADDGFHIWSQNYDRTLDDIFAIQDEIAADVARALDSSLLGGGNLAISSVATSNLTAYESYLKGLEQQAIFSYGSLALAEGHFKQALARDPEFTDARLALVRNYLLKNGTGLLNNEDTHKQVGPLIRQVRESDQKNHLARAFELVTMMRGSFGASKTREFESIITELRQLLALIPTETYIRLQVAVVLNFFFDDPESSIEVLQVGLLIDPLAADLHLTLGDIYRRNDRLTEARAALDKAIQLAPGNPNTLNGLSDLEKKSNHLPAALEWARLATETDSQDHELAAEIAQVLYALELPEEGDRWYARVKALSPDSAVTRRVELNRAMARKEYAQAEKLARSMISDQVENRHGEFPAAVFTYVTLMFRANTTQQGYDFLLSVRPEISNYEVLAPDRRGGFMQQASIVLMTGFESFEVRQQAWLNYTAALDTSGFPWRRQEGYLLSLDKVINGDIDAAIEHYLEYRLSRPMATDIRRHKRGFEPFYRDVFADPRVAARLAEKDREFAQLRDTVSELMLEPEWNQ